MIDNSIRDFRRLDQLALGDSAIHRLDARTKVLTTLAFILFVISYDRYTLSALIPFAIFPVIIMAVADLPVVFLAGKVLLIALLAMAIGLFNPVFDRQSMIWIGDVGISAGWISFGSIVLRSALTITAALLLTATTGFSAICQALSRLGMPEVFVRQLQFMYRYLFVLAEEAQRMVRARELRSFRKSGREAGALSSMVGHLLLRTWERAERIQIAMRCRGFNGRMAASRSAGFGAADLFFLLGWISLFTLIRLYDIPRLIGDALMNFKS